MKILVTGTSGFIGPLLATKLIDSGHEVWGMERYTTGRTMYKQDNRLNKVFSNLNDFFCIQKTIKLLQPEVVFHLAACSPVAYSYDRPIEVTRTNYLSTVNLAESCIRSIEKFKHFIFAGTSEEYGNQTEFPIKENAELKPNSPYAVSKLASENYLHYMQSAYDFPVTICRPFNTYGRVGTNHFVTERIITQALKGCDEICLGDPTPIRDFLFREDHVEGYMSVFENNEKAIGKTFNFCTGIGVTVKELAELIVEKTGFQGKVRFNTIPKRPLDIATLIGDCERANRILGWSPKYTLSEGLDITIDDLKKMKQK